MEIIEAYTDGSSLGNPGKGGWAVVFTSKRVGTFTGKSEYTTNNRMELTAAISAVKETCNYRKHAIVDKAVVYSDSSYVVNAVNKGWLVNWDRNGWKNSSGESVKNIDLWQKLLFMLEKAKAYDVEVEFIKVKGHAGNEFNERADALAKEAASNA